MPPDPFADDPNDPASFLEDDEPAPPPLTPAERQQLQFDLKQVHEFRRLLEPRGILGIVFPCDECDDIHCYSWDILIANMQATLDGDLTIVHEPSTKSEAGYVPWDYCVGYCDALDHRRGYTFF